MPLLHLELYEKDEYIFICNEEIENIFYLFKGQAKLVVLFSENKDFAYFNQGNDFGLKELFFKSAETNKSI